MSQKVLGTRHWAHQWDAQGPGDNIEQWLNKWSQESKWLELKSWGVL